MHVALTAAKIRPEERRLPTGVFENRLTLHGPWTFRELCTMVVAVMALVVSSIPKTAWTFVFTRSQVTPETLVLLLSLSLFSLPAEPGTSLTAPVLPWTAARTRFPWSCMALTACGQVHVALFQVSTPQVFIDKVHCANTHTVIATLTKRLCRLV
ncbi:hypothetical protein MRX96_020619 [Rhipicephalus microplus]